MIMRGNPRKLLAMLKQVTASELQGTLVSDLGSSEMWWSADKIVKDVAGQRAS